MLEFFKLIFRDIVGFFFLVLHTFVLISFNKIEISKWNATTTNYFMNMFSMELISHIWFAWKLCKYVIVDHSLFFSLSFSICRMWRDLFIYVIERNKLIFHWKQNSPKYLFRKMSSPNHFTCLYSLCTCEMSNNDVKVFFFSAHMLINYNKN